MNLGILDNIQLELDTLSTLIKLIYAFLWQEYVLTGSDIFLDPEVNILGAAFMSTVNSLANYLNSFPVLSDALQSGYGVYPGDTWCNPQVHTLSTSFLLWVIHILHYCRGKGEVEKMIMIGYGVDTDC